MAETALWQVGLDQVLWVPSRNPPYKSQADITDIHHRLELIKRAIAYHDAFDLSTAGLNHPGASYAVDTWQLLQKRDPTSTWFWIIGLDAFLSLPRWRRCEDLIPHCTWLVAPRLTPDPALTGDNGSFDAQHTLLDQAIMNWMTTRHHSQEESQSQYRLVCQQIDAKLQQAWKKSTRQPLTLQWQLLDMPILWISSSLVRHYCGDRRSIRYLVPDSVRDYIENHQLYRP